MRNGIKINGSKTKNSDRDKFYSTAFFFYLGFLSITFTIHRTAGEGEGISLTPLYHFTRFTDT